MEMKQYIKSFLKNDERVWAEAGVSVIALLFIWLSIPLFVGCIYLPPIIIIVRKGKRLADFLRLFRVGSNGAFVEIFGVAKPIMIFAFIMLGLLVLAWIGFCVVMTIRHFGYEIVCTDYRVIGRAKRKLLISPWSSVQNVFIERSWLGKVFDYGTITISTKRETVTFRNIKEPEEIKQIIFSKIEKWD